MIHQEPECRKVLNPDTMGCGWVQVPIIQIQVPNWVLAGFESPHMDSSLNLRKQFQDHGWAEDEQKVTVGILLSRITASNDPITQGHA